MNITGTEDILQLIKFINRHKEQQIILITRIFYKTNKTNNPLKNLL